MRTIVAVIVLICAIAMPFLGWLGCAHVAPAVDAGRFCADQAVSDAAGQVVTRLESILACSIDVREVPSCALAEVEAFAKQFGEDVLLCALSEIASRRGAAPGSLAAVVSGRAARVLHERAGK